MNARAKLSSKGQLVIPKSVRDAHGWTAGTEFEFVDKGRDVAIRPLEKMNVEFPRVTKEEFLAMIPEYHGPPITEEMIGKAVIDETRRRWNARRR